MNVQKKILSGKTVPSGIAFTKCTSIEKKSRFLPGLKPFTATCSICKKGFVVNCSEKGTLHSCPVLQSRDKPSVCQDCDKSFVWTASRHISSPSILDQHHLNEENTICSAAENGRSIDEQLTSTHIGKKVNSCEKDDEWVIVKVGENGNEVETEKVFSIKLCDEECNEESMVFQAGEEETEKFSRVIAREDPEEDMMTQDSDCSVKDIIQIGSLSFGSSCSDSDSLGYSSQASDVPSTSKSFTEVDRAWSVCTNKFTTGVGKLDNWTVCTKGFSIRGESSHVCQLCKKYFKSESDLKFHMMSHSSLKSSIPTQSFQGLKEKKSSDAVGEVRELHTCSVCSKTFSDVGLLKAHSKIHFISLSDNSSNVFKKVSPKGLLNRNPFIQVNEKIMACTICGARFQHKQQLAKHMKAHLILTCKICQRVFKSSAKLKKHMHQVCGNVSAPVSIARDGIGNEIPSTSHSTNTNLIKLREGNGLDSFDKRKDICIQGSSGKVEEKNIKGLQNYIVIDNQKCLNPETVGIASKEEECDISPLKSIVIENVKEEDIDIEDFPMVEDYYVVHVKDEILNINSDDSFTVSAEKKNCTVRKSKCNKR